MRLMPVYQRLCLALALGGFAAARLSGEPVISEFMAANTSVLADDDGAFSDWIEIHNPDAAPLNLAGWYLTDNAAQLTKWQFPAVTIPSGGYLVVFASNKNRRDPSAMLHTNFALSAGGEYLGLIKPDGVTPASHYAPAFPEQLDDISYGLTTKAGQTTRGYLRKPTPGAPNSDGNDSAGLEPVRFSRPAGPFWNSVRVTLSGADAASGQRIRYVVASGAGASAAEPTASSPVYSDVIELQSSAVIRAAVFSDDNTLRGPVTSAHYLKLNASVSSFSSQLPVLVLDNLGAGQLVKDGKDHETWLYTFNAGSADSRVFVTAPTLATPLEASVRGASSADFPKKSYNIKLRDELGEDRAVPLLDLPAYEKWALVAPWSFDPNFFNNSFVYTLSQRLGRWAPRSRLVEVFFNTDGGELDASDYVGIYAITDRIEPGEGRVDVAKLKGSDNAPPNITGGYILKIDLKDTDENGWITDAGVPNNGYSSVVLVAPKAEDVTPAQLGYIRDYVQQMEDALISDLSTGFAQRTYLDFIDRASWVDHHLLNVFVSNPDAFHRSAYFTKPRGGKLAAGPVWDFDRALGAFWDDRSSVMTTWSGVNGAVDFWRNNWWGLIANDPEFRQDWIDRWQSVRRDELSDTNLHALADFLAATVGVAAANRDVARWPDSASVHGSYPAQIAHLKTWLSGRAKWIDEQFVAAPGKSESGGTLTFTPPKGAKLLYTLDGSDPRSLGGGIAPNALESTAPVSVPATANVHVRAYRAELAAAFPATPWSSPVCGSASTPLKPQARLINISARAVAGTGENALIAGVVVADSLGKRFLTRAIGPALGTFGASNFMPDPQLSVFGGNGVELFRNTGWQTGPDAGVLPTYAKAVGAFPLPANSNDSALASALRNGSYTVQVSSPTGQSGLALAELYELDGNGRTVNLSTRAQVGTGDGVLIGGFVVQGPAHKRMLIRAVGPTLAGFGVGNALADPVLTLYSGSTTVATNDRWDAGSAAAVVATASAGVGAFALPAGSEDAALFVTLAPGAYTVEVKGKSGGQGVALLEIYEVP